MVLTGTTARGGGGDRLRRGVCRGARGESAESVADEDGAGGGDQVLLAGAVTVPAPAGHLENVVHEGDLEAAVHAGAPGTTPAAPAPRAGSPPAGSAAPAGGRG